VRALRIVLLIALVLVAVVALSGIWLVFRYRPNPVAALGAPRVAGDHPAQVVRAIHRLGSLGLLLASTVVVVLAVVDRVGRRVGRVAIAVVTIPLVASAWVTGLLLPWTQLALYSVQVGESFRGYQWLWNGQDVRFVLIGQTEVSTTAVAWLLIAHVTLGLLMTAAFSALLVRADRPEPQPLDTGELSVRIAVDT
jgi:quinol-cytochrome oxidoreductase complex cytochrome b subunit